jgi:hypothetical protein
MFLAGLCPVYITRNSWDYDRAFLGQLTGGGWWGREPENQTPVESWGTGESQLVVGGEISTVRSKVTEDTSLCVRVISEVSSRVISKSTNKKTNFVALSPQANYTDWATATCRRNLVPTFVDRGVSRGQRGGSPKVVNLSFFRPVSKSTLNLIINPNIVYSHYRTPDKTIFNSISRTSVLIL